MIWRRITGFLWRHKKALLVLVAILFFILVWPMNLLGMAPVWSRSVTAQVVDAETGEPLEGVVVEAIWPSVTGTLAGGPHHWGIIQRLETQTDEKGFFHLPSWVRIGYHNWISVTDPEIHLYKAGYWPRTLKNDINKFDQIIIWPEPWKSDWDGKVIKLEPMHWREWTKEEWEKQIKKHEYLWAYGRIPADNGCGWMKVPHNVIEDIRFDIRRKELVDRSMVVAEEIKEILINAKDNCGVDVFQYLSQFGLTPEEWKACCSE